MKIITSVHNDQIKHLINLGKKSYRIQHQEFLIEGTRAYHELVQLYKPLALFMTQDYQNAHQDIACYEKITTILAPHVMEKVSAAATPSGICAIFAIPAQQPLPSTGPGIILMDVHDPGNMGTLIRTAAAMNIKKVIIIGGVDPYSPKVIQSTAGCLAAVRLYQSTFDKLAAQHTLHLCALVVQGGKTPDQLNLQHKFLVVGSEAHGLSAQQIALCQEKMTIPMPGQAESLNAGVAGSIGLYLMSQQN